MFESMFKQHPRQWMGMALLAATSLMGLAGCITGGGGAESGAAITRTSDPAASKDARAVQKYLAALTRGGFARAFFEKGRLSPVLTRIPVSVVLDERTALWGAAAYALAAG